MIALASFISPYQQDRDEARSIHQESDIPFIEVFVDVPLHVAESRDPKGLYKKARAGEIKGKSRISRMNLIFVGFTGIDSPYEAPQNPELHLPNDQVSVDEAVTYIISHLQARGLINIKKITAGLK